MSKPGRSAAGVRGAGVCALAALAVSIIAAGSLPSAAAGERAALRRAIVPAQDDSAWPAGDWERVPTDALLEFERAYERGAIAQAAPPLIDWLVFSGKLADGTILDGQFEAHVQRLDPAASFLDLGNVTPAVREIEWPDRPAVWGTADDGAVLLHVDREADTFRGKWSQRGEEVLGGAEFDLRLFPAASIRIELALPAAYELQSSRGVVLGPAADNPDQLVWAIELGQQSSCLCTVVPRSDSPPIVTMPVERIAAWSMRPDGCRLQADFNISIPASSPATLEFVLPDDLQNPEVSSTSGVNLPAELDRRSTPPRLVVPLPRLASGRLGIVRVSGDLPLREGGDWILPEVRLENSIVASSTRRVHVDRPLKLLSIDTQGVRQSNISIDDVSGDWTFEDAAADARITVRVGRPPAALMLRAVTILDSAPNESRFHSAVELLSRGGGDFEAELRFPSGWGIIDVGTPPGERGTVTSWEAAETDLGVRLEIEFRQSLSAQAPRRLLISGRRVGGSSASRETTLFPVLDGGGDSRTWLGIRHAADTNAAFTPRGGIRTFAPDEAAPEWTRLMPLLGISGSDANLAWFTQSQSAETGTVAWGPLPAQEPANPRSPVSPGIDARSAPDAGPFTLDLLLDTDVGGHEAEWVRHRARYLLSGRRPEVPPQIQLPAGAQIDGLSIDGEPQNVVSESGTIELLEWPPAPRLVELRFHTRAAGPRRWLSRELSVPLPAWSQATHTLEWQLKLPHMDRISDVRIPASAVQPPPESGWCRRLFGPLARADWLPTANPFSIDSWLRRLWPSGQAAAGEVTISTPAPGATLTVELMDVRNVDRAGWLAVLGAGLVSSLLRLCGRRGATILWVIAGLLLLGASLLPFVTATICGGALIGLLFAVLLPRQWILPARRPAEPIASLSSLHRAGAAIGAGVLLISAWHSQSQAQPAPVSPPPEFDMLIPENAGVPDEMSLIQRRLLPLFEKWRRTSHHDPAYLLQSARYSLDTPDSPELRARFTVAVFDQSPRVPVLLPFGHVWVPDPDACRVDDQPAQIRPATSSNALLVEVPGAGEAAAATTSDIELTLQLSAAARHGSGWEFDVPRVFDTQLALPAAAEPLTTLSQLGTRADETGRPVYEIGGRSTIVLQPTAVAATAPAESVTADAVSLIEVHPLRLRVRTQLRLSTGDRSGMLAGPQRLRLLLPVQADVREVAVAGLRSYMVRHPRRETTLVELELDRFPSSDTAIHLDFTLPVQQPSDGLIIPPLPLLGEDRMQGHRIGLRVVSGMTLDPPSTASLPAQLREMPAELFSAGLGSDTALPIPSHVYLATAPAALSVMARPIEPRKTASLEQSIVVQERSLHWQATADVVVADAPAYQHEFELNSAVQLDSVSLVQDEVGRLLDWSHDGDRLVLFLPGDRVGTQQVRLSGTMKVEPSAVTLFPAFALRDARITSSELLVQTTPSQRLELFAADGSELPPSVGSSRVDLQACKLEYSIVSPK